MKKTFKYRIYGNRQTVNNANNWLELCRKLYNECLQFRIDIYKESKKSISCYEQMSLLPKIKQEYPEYKQVGSQVLQDVIQRLDRAYQAFFRRIKNNEKAGFPRFKSKYRYDSFTLKQAGWKLENKCLTIRNIGRFKIKLSRPIEGIIKTTTIRRTQSDKWFVCFNCDDVPVRQFPDTNKEVGIDVGIKNFAVDSEGGCIANPKYFSQSQKLLRMRQRKLARRKKGSNRRNKARILVAKVYEKISNQRNDFLHKLANSYIKDYKTIYIENLAIRNMVHNRYLSKSIMDASWGIFFGYLSYKAVEADRIVIKVKPQGTSQICSICGEIVPKTLSIRIHSCPNCGSIMDRDFNSSINIKKLGQSFRDSIPAMAGMSRESLVSSCGGCHEREDSRNSKKNC